MTNSTTPQLKRNLSLALVTFYGVGTILGAGIYVLIGHVFADANRYTPLAFLVAAVIAGLSAFSYAELVARYPKSAGEAVYIDQAFNWRWLSILTGLSVTIIGLVSTAVMIHGFYGYLNDFIQVPQVPTLICSVIVLTVIVAWGISQSVWLAAAITVIEIMGLLIIIWVGRSGLAGLVTDYSTYIPDLSYQSWQGIMLGAFIAFYAFIGFEDMVNVAEEVREPTRNLPRAIIIALIVTTLLYIIVALVYVSVMSSASVVNSAAPLADLYRQQTGEAATVIHIISLLSLLNGALVQLIMASRILYGMSQQKWIPAWIGRVNPVTHTPVIATILISVLVLIAVLTLPLIDLARLTSFITLVIFVLINFALIRLKHIDRHVDVNFSVPVWVPVAGFIMSTLLIVMQMAGFN